MKDKKFHQPMHPIWGGLKPRNHKNGGATDRIVLLKKVDGKHTHRRLKNGQIVRN